MRRASWLAALLLFAACGDAVAGPPPVTAATQVPLAGFSAGTLVVDGELEWPVMIADTADLRAQGLMSVTDLGPWVGMVFVFDKPTDSGFWMKDTLIPLTVFWFNDGEPIVASAEMIPCPTGESNCPHWRPGAVYMQALEVPAGMGQQLGITGQSTLQLLRPSL